jgi:hypothetical protein
MNTKGNFFNIALVAVVALAFHPACAQALAA